MKDIKYICVHHSAGDEKQTRHGFYDEALRGGFSDIPYHRLILYGGIVCIGRPDYIMDAAQRGLNEETFSICIAGNFEKNFIGAKDIRILKLIQVLVVALRVYKLSEKSIIFHREVAGIINNKKVATLCPGKHLYKLKPFIITRVKGYLSF